MLDENEFLSPYGIRSLSKYHKDHPYSLTLDGHEYSISYQPGESQTGMFGGNSNWRRPVWFPLNYLMIESLQKYDYYYGNDFTIEFPTGSARELPLWEIAAELSRRLMHLFLPSATDSPPRYGYNGILQSDPHLSDYLLFHEYFHGATGKGIGASHQA